MPWLKNAESWTFGTEYKNSLAGWLEYLVLSGILFKKTWCGKTSTGKYVRLYEGSICLFSLWCSTGSLSLEMPNQYFWLFCGLEKPVSVINVPEDVQFMPSWGRTLYVPLFMRALNLFKKIWSWPKLCGERARRKVRGQPQDQFVYLRVRLPLICASKGYDTHTPTKKPWS